MNDYRTEHPVAACLTERGITRVAVIDDAVDPPTRADVEIAVDEFWAAVEAEEGLLTALSALVGKRIAKGDDIDDAAVQAIWAEKSRDAELAELTPLVNILVGPIEDRVRPLRTLRRRLEEELRRETIWHGSLEQLTDTAPQMIFVDYYMGRGHGENEVRAAKEIVNNVNELYKDAEFRPVIVLMSSAGVSAEMVEEFRRSSGWLAGMFYFIRKDDFGDADVFFMRLVSFAQAVPAGHRVQALVDALAGRVHDVADRFLEDVKALQLSDYAYLQMMSLHEDGHPLGEYMLWLYGAYIGQLLFDDEGVRAQRREIDKLVFADLPGAQAPPSDTLARLYESATVEAVESELGHPRAPAGTAATPQLHLGDVFAASGRRDVLVIVNAQCDLVFAPGVRTRPFRPDRAIVMVPGEVQPLREPMKLSDAGKPRTEMFRCEEGFCRIVWDPKRIATVPYGEVSEWLGGRSYELVARLRLPAALQVQQAFAADLTRVGLPTAPPIQRVVVAELYCTGENGRGMRVAEDSGGAYLFMRRGGASCVLADEFAIQVKAALETAGTELSKYVEFLEGKNAGEDSLGTARRKGEAIVAMAARQDVAARLRVPFEPPAVGKQVALKDLPIMVQYGGTVSASYRCEQPLLVWLREREES